MNVLSKIWNKWKVERRFSKGFYPPMSAELEDKIKLKFLAYRYEEIDLVELFESVKNFGFDISYFFPFFIDIIRIGDIKQHKLIVKGD